MKKIVIGLLALGNILAFGTTSSGKLLVVSKKSPTAISTNEIEIQSHFEGHED